MKFFKKYYLVLPPVALIYGIYILNIKYPYDGFPQTLKMLKITLPDWDAQEEIYRARLQHYLEESYISCSKVRSSSIYTVCHGPKKIFIKKVQQGFLYH